MKNVRNILNEIVNSNLSVDELRMINQFVIEQIKNQRSVQNSLAKVSLKEGMTVRVNHPKLQGRQFILHSIKRSKAVVRAEGEMFGGYNVPLSLVESI